MKYHLAILKKQYLDAIIDGTKTIESRFMKGIASPFGKVNAGDVIFLKQSAGPIKALAKVKQVACFENLNSDMIQMISRQYNSLIQGNDLYWQDVSGKCKCGFLAWLDDVKMLPPQKISKKDMRAWVILNEEKNFGLFETYSDFLEI